MSRRPGRRRRSERGIALMTTMLVTLLLSSLLIGFAVMVGSDNQLSTMAVGNTDAFYLAQAGLEKLTSDLGMLFVADTAPSGDEVRALGDAPPPRSTTSPTSRRTVATATRSRFRRRPAIPRPATR